MRSSLLRSLRQIAAIAAIVLTSLTSSAFAYWSNTGEGSASSEPGDALLASDLERHARG